MKSGSAPQASRFDFRSLEPEPQGWFGRLLNRPNPGGALRAIENRLSDGQWEELGPEWFAEILRNYRVKPLEVRDGLLDLYRRAVNTCVSEGELTQAHQAQLNRLTQLFELDAASANAEKSVVAEAKYRESVEAALSDRWLTDEEKADLSRLASKLAIPADRVTEIHRELFGGVFNSKFVEAIEDHRLSPSEEQDLDRMAQNLGLQPSYDPATQEVMDHFRLLWRLQNGDLPTVRADVNLQRGETCHWTGSASLHEMRRVTTGVRYAGPTVRVRIMKGVSWRMGQIALDRISHDELKQMDTGTLYITNKRLLFDGSGKTTNLPIRRILRYTVHSDGLRIEKDSGKDQYFMMSCFDGEVLGAVLDGVIGSG